MSLEEFNSKLEVLQAIPEKEIKSPNMPVDVFLQESENLYQWCQADQAALTNTGLDWTLVEDLPARTGALRHAESVWFSQRYDRQEAQKLWNEKSPAAYDLRSQILHDMHFAYRKDDALAARVSQISDGAGHADMIQDLYDMAVLGKENPAPLQAISFDLALLDQAEATAGELGELLGLATTSREDNSAARVMRDRAYTHLKEAVDEIRDCGQYVFWRDGARLKGYVSMYRRRQNRSSSSVPIEEQTD
jgi:hypothetical protein